MNSMTGNTGTALSNIVLVFCILYIQVLGADEKGCPPQVNPPFNSHLPAGLLENSTKGIIITTTNLTDIKVCVSTCCAQASCNAALLINKDDRDQCWLVSCARDELCLPSTQFSDYESTLVLVHATTPPWPVVEVREDTECEVGAGEEVCRPGEVCRQLHSKSRSGVCRCEEGSINTAVGCARKTSTSVAPATTPVPQVYSIAVSVGNKTIRLPERSAVLTAFTIPGNSEQNPLKYEWRAQTTGRGGTESGSNSETLQLSGLDEGVYVFKVIVTASSPPGYGEAVANVTVLPVPRINTPPTAVLVPSTQIVTLPTKKAVIDGSKSSDDSGSVTYSWQVASGPMGYQPSLPSVPTLTLDNLIEGNYTIKLTVKDVEGEESSTVSYLTVLQETDYPPKANAGEDKIVYLPQNTVILNGNQSSDDHEIQSWEWTKKKTDDGLELPADITGARSPYLKVANLEKGIYTFVLKVTDSAGQSRTDEVSVYVKPPSNLPPKAEAGEDLEFSLPLPFFTLDGSNSSDDLNITQYQWTQVEGPKHVNISKPWAAVTNVTNLVPGIFKFQLTVSDASGNNASDTVAVTIKQDTNQAPVAKIIQPKGVDLPLSSLVLDGSKSSDDLAIEIWQWSRSSESVAAGVAVGGLDSPQLVVTNLIPGIYVFSLKVTDGQGKTDTARVSFTVSEDKEVVAQVEMILDKDLSLLAQSELRNILDAVRIFLMTKADVELVNLYPAHRSGFSTIVFKAKADDDKHMKGSVVVALLKRTLASNPEVLGVPVLSLETVVCQNECGGHGTCDQASRECNCQPFWVENGFKRYVLHGEPNCDWSVIYVLVVCLGLVVGVLLLYCVYCGCRKKSKAKYARLSGGDLELTGRSVDPVFTDTETDEEDVLFESAKRGRRPNGTLRGGQREGHNGTVKKNLVM